MLDRGFVRNFTDRDALINSIIDMEWHMFDKVNNVGGRATCQDDYKTFYIMRYSQFSLYSINLLTMYKQDVTEAMAMGRNLITEKYAYMMEYTDPEYYRRQLLPSLPRMTKSKGECIGRIVSILMQSEFEFAVKYSAINDRNRPLAGTSKKDTSFMVYTRGELKTYSERTLKAMLTALEELTGKGVNPSMVIHDTTVKFYGYADLDDAELKLRRA